MIPRPHSALPTARPSGATPSPSASATTMLATPARARRPRRDGGSRASRSRTSCRSRASRCREQHASRCEASRPTSRPSRNAPPRLTTSVPSGNSPTQPRLDRAVDEEARDRAERRRSSRPRAARSPVSLARRTIAAPSSTRGEAGGEARRRVQRRAARTRAWSSILSSSSCIVENVVSAPQNPVPRSGRAVGRHREPLLQPRDEVAEQRTRRRRSPRTSSTASPGVVGRRLLQAVRLRAAQRAAGEDRRQLASVEPPSSPAPSRSTITSASV